MRILIVEDDRIFLENMKLFLQDLGYAVDSTLTLAKADEYLYIYQYDLLLLDVNLPDGNGFEFCLKIRDDASMSLPIIIITAREELKDRILGLDNGADDYLVKPFAFEELRARIQAVFRRSKYKATNDMQLGDIKILSSEFKVLIQEEHVAFNTKEYEILYYLFIHYPNPQSLEQIIEHVWDEEANPFSNSARVYITNIRKKLTQNSREVVLKNKPKVGFYLCIQ